MGNIITQANDNDRAYDIDATGNLSLLNTLSAKTGVFANNSWFKQDIRVDGTIDGVDVAALKTTVDGMAGAGQGTFTGKSVAALNFTGTSGNFDNLTVSATGTFGAIKTSLLDINGNITSSVGPKYITASTASGLKLENGSTTSNGFVQVNSNGSISIIPYSGTSLILGGNMTGSGNINAGAGTFSSLSTSGTLSAGAGTLTSLNLTNALTGTAGTFSGLLTGNGGLTTTSLTGTDGTFSGMLTANGGLIVPTTKTLTFGGNMTGTGTINAGAGTFSSLTTSGGLTGTAGTFSGMLTANGGLTLPSSSSLTFGGNMTGAGTINAGAGTFSGLLTATEGLKIGPSTSVNNWQIKENSGGDLCFFRSGNAFACINNSGNLYAPAAPAAPAAAPAATKVVFTDFVTFPMKTTWVVGDKFVMKEGTNNVSRGIITDVSPPTFTNGLQGEIIYNVTDGNNTTKTNQKLIILAFNVSARADNSNGNPATSLLRWA